MAGRTGELREPCGDTLVCTRQQRSPDTCVPADASHGEPAEKRQGLGDEVALKTQTHACCPASVPSCPVSPGSKDSDSSQAPTPFLPACSCFMRHIS